MVPHHFQRILGKFPSRDGTSSIGWLNFITCYIVLFAVIMASTTSGDEVVTEKSLEQIQTPPPETKRRFMFVRHPSSNVVIMKSIRNPRSLDDTGTSSRKVLDNYEPSSEVNSESSSDTVQITSQKYYEDIIKARKHSINYAKSSSKNVMDKNEPSSEENSNRSDSSSETVQVTSQKYYEDFIKPRKHSINHARSSSKKVMDKNEPSSEENSNRSDSSSETVQITSQKYYYEDFIKPRKYSSNHAESSSKKVMDKNEPSSEENSNRSESSSETVNNSKSSSKRVEDKNESFLRKYLNANNKPTINEENSSSPEYVRKKRYYVRENDIESAVTENYAAFVRNYESFSERYWKDYKAMRHELESPSSNYFNHHGEPISDEDYGSIGGRYASGSIQSSQGKLWIFMVLLLSLILL